MPVIYLAVLLASVYLLVAGHNHPGGGFVGGLVAGAGVAVRYITGGIDEVRSLARVRPWTILGTGLLVASVTATVPLLFGDAPLEAASWEFDVAVFGHVKVSSVLALRHRRVPRGRRPRADGLRGVRRRLWGDIVTVTLAFAAATLFGVGTYLVLQRKLSRIIIGLGLLTHGANVLLMTSGRAGDEPLIGVGDVDDLADPLPHALALTAIVITFGVSALLLAMAFRSWILRGDDEVENDVADTLIARGGVASARCHRRGAGRRRGRTGSGRVGAGVRR